MAPLDAVTITNNIIAQLRAADPAISAEIGTPERKIIEAVAQVVSLGQSDLSVLNSQYDVDTMTGNRLDQFLANFGFGRQRSTNATGTVTFSRTTPADIDYVIPQGTQVISRQTDAGFPSVLFATTVVAVLATGLTSVDVTVEATLPGSLSNIPANSIYQIVGTQTVPGITDVTNNNVISGGTDGETDDEFKVRFKNTIFRNMAGTSDQFLALAVSLSNVSKANVVGPQSQYQEFIQVPGNENTFADVDTASNDVHQSRPYDPSGTLWPYKRTTAVSTIPYSKYTYDSGYFLTDGSTDPGATFYRDGFDYVFNNPRVKEGVSPWGAQSDTTGPQNFQPNVTLLNLYTTTNLGGIPPNTILLLEHRYMSTESRNDVTLGIFNCVDIFIDGQNPTQVTSIEPTPGAQVFINASDGSSMLDPVNYRRLLDNSQPEPSNLLSPLFWQPMTTLPDNILVGDNTYYKANFYNTGDSQYYNDPEFSIQANYYEIIDVTELYGSVRARNGIEWDINVAGVPTGDASPTIVNAESVTTYNLSYFYDENVADLQALVEQNKQITTDVLVHQAQPVYLKLYITVAYSPGADISGTNFAITQQLANFYSTQYYGAAIQLSDLLQQVHNTPGVDNVRFTTDPSTGLFTSGYHAIEIVNKDGSSQNSPVYKDSDFFIRDNQLVTNADINGTDVTSVIIVKKRATNVWNS